MLLGHGWVFTLGLLYCHAPYIQTVQLFDRQQARFKTVIDVMSIVSQIIADIRDLGFNRLEGANGVAVMFGTGFFCQMLSQACAQFPGKVQPIEVRVPSLKLLNPPAALDIVVEPSFFPHEFIEGAFSHVAKRAVADIMGEGNGFGEVFVGAQGMGQACAVVIGGAVDKDLGFIFKTPKTPTVNNPISIPLEFSPQTMWIFRKRTAPAAAAFMGIRRKVRVLKFFLLNTGSKHAGNMSWLKT